MHKQKLSTDKIIQIALMVLVVILLIALIGKNKTTDDAWTIDNEDIMIEEITEGETEVTPEGVAPVVTPSATKPATGGSASSSGVNSPNTNPASCKPSLTGSKSEELKAIILKWSTCDSGDFQFYKLVKSSINAEPSYPADPTAFSSPNRSAANFVDKTVARATTYYYRLCVVERLGKVSCSNKVTVSY